MEDMTLLALALEWHLKKIGKFSGANVVTKNGELVNWEVKGVNEPNESEKLNIISEYKNFLISVKNEKKQRLDAIKNKINLSDDELDSLKEFIRG